MKTTAFFLSMLLTMLFSGIVSGQQKPTTGYAPVNGLKMYYEIHGSGEPVVLLHGAFMAISGDWNDWIGELSKTRKVIAVEMQGHGRTADINRDLSYENLSDDVAGLLDYLKIPSADIIGYSLGGGVAMQCAIRHPEKVRKVVSISAPFRRDGWVKEANDFWPTFTWEIFKGTPMEAEYKRLSPTPEKFPDFVNHIKARTVRPCLPITLPMSGWATRISMRVIPLRSISRTSTASASSTRALTIISMVSRMSNQ